MCSSPELRIIYFTSSCLSCRSIRYSTRALHQDMATVAKVPWSNEDTQSNQHGSLSTISSSDSDSEDASRFYQCCPTKHYLHAQVGQTRQQMTTDLLCIGTGLDFPQRHPHQERVQSSHSNPIPPDLKSRAVRWQRENLLPATSEKQTSVRPPIERWLVEKRKDGPFNMLVEGFALNPVHLEDSNSFDHRGLESSSSKDRNYGNASGYQIFTEDDWKSRYLEEERHE